MALAVCLLFDLQADRALRELWDLLEERGVATLRTHTHGMHRPHVSYAVALDWDLGAVRAELEKLPSRGGFEITFDALGAFRRGRLSLVPAGPADLVARQQAVVTALRSARAVVHHHYEAGHWLPHCLIAPRVQLVQLPVAAATVYSVLPLTAQITRAALIDSTTGESWPLAAIP